MLTKEEVQSLAQSAIMPKEEKLEIGKKGKNLYIGIPKEASFQETRVALVPEAVALLVSNGHRVVVETKAGEPSNFQDHDYSEAGAEIAYDQKKVWEADIVLKVAPPLPEEVEMMQHRQTLFSALQLTVQPKDFLKKLMNKKISAIAWDFIKDDIKTYPVIRAMGEIAGNTSILIAGEYLSAATGGQGLMLGGIPGVAPAEVVILGAGAVGEFAARAAIGLGAQVMVFDNSVSKLRRLQNALGVRVATSVIQPGILKDALGRADVAIGAIKGAGSQTPCVVTEGMVEGMKEGSVIVDVSIDRGGCFATSKPTTHTEPTYRKHGVIHYCVPNIASRVPRTASCALSNIFSPILMNFGEFGGFEGLINHDEGFARGVYIYNGVLTSKDLGEAFGLPFKDLNLFRAAM
jgi:alanine dehydrogenase